MTNEHLYIILATIIIIAIFVYLLYRFEKDTDELLDLESLKGFTEAERQNNLTDTRY